MNENVICVCVKKSYDQYASTEMNKKATCESWKVATNRTKDLKYIVGYLTENKSIKPVTFFKIKETLKDNNRIKFVAEDVSIDELFLLNDKISKLKKTIRNPVFYTSINI